MPIPLLEEYIDKAPRVQARRILMFAEAAGIPQMKDDARKSRIRELERTAGYGPRLRSRKGRRIEELKQAGIGDVIADG